MANASEFVRLEPYRYPPDEMRARAEDFYREMKRRRSVRDFSAEVPPREVLEHCLLTAGTAPNGANLQPWHFVVVSNPAVKAEIRKAAEAEEEAFYARRAPEDWLEALAPLGTDANKPFLETTPYLIAVFAQTYGLGEGKRKIKHYYVTESVGIATGLLVTALHHAGLACLTHTPSPMGFLNTILNRPPNERPFVLLVVGYPADDAQVPRITKKTLSQLATFV